MFEVTLAAMFVLFVVSPVAAVLRPGAHESENQPFVL